MNAFEAAEKNGKAKALQQELDALFTKENTSAGKNETCIAAAFLRVTVNV